MVKLVATVLQVVGLMAAVAGLAWIAPPLGLIGAGLALVLVGVIADMPGDEHE